MSGSWTKVLRTERRESLSFLITLIVSTQDILQRGEGEVEVMQRGKNSVRGGRRGEKMGRGSVSGRRSDGGLNLPCRNGNFSLSYRRLVTLSNNQCLRGQILKP